MIYYRPCTKYDGRLYFQFVCQYTGGRGVPCSMVPWSLVPGPFPVEGVGLTLTPMARTRTGYPSTPTPWHLPGQDKGQGTPCSQPGPGQVSSLPCESPTPCPWPGPGQCTGIPTPPPSQDQDRGPSPTQPEPGQGTPYLPLSHLARTRTWYSHPTPSSLPGPGQGTLPTQPGQGTPCPAPPPPAWPGPGQGSPYSPTLYPGGKCHRQDTARAVRHLRFQAGGLSCSRRATE